MLTWWMWMILGLVLLACEVITSGTFFFIFLGISGLLTGIAAYLLPDMPGWTPWLLFSVFSAISFAFFRKPLMEKFKHSGKHGAKVDALTAETAVALEDIAPGAMGKVELRGTSWSARNVGDQSVKRSERLKVDRVDGLTLCIRGE
jgi:inner membrane protein